MTSATARANAARRVALTIATPAYDGKVLTDYTRSLLGTVELLGRQGIPVAWIDLGGEALVQRARARLVAEFLATPDATHSTA